MKIIFLQVKRHIDNPARLISMCLDEKFNKTLYFYYIIGSFLCKKTDKLFF